MHDLDEFGFNSVRVQKMDYFNSENKRVYKINFIRDMETYEEFIDK